MPLTSERLRLSAEEKAILQTSDEGVEAWHARAQRGDGAAKEQLCRWAYLTAHEYYHAKVGTERSLTYHDAEELAGEFFVELEQSLPQIRIATRYTRHMLKAKLQRYLKRKRKLQLRETSLPGLAPPVPPPPDDRSQRPWEHWSDTEWYQYQATLQVLQEADETTRTIVEMRVRDAAYAEIARVVELSEAALRMRVARFYKAVRERFELLRP